MSWSRSRLGRKFALGTAAGLVASSLVFLLLFLGLYRAELAGARAATAEQVNQLLQTSLENAMLKRDIDGLREIVERLGRQYGVDSVFITDPRGEIRFASDPSLLNAVHPFGGTADTVFTQFVVNRQGRTVLRSVNPVANQDVCTECHGPTSDNPVNGVLYVDYDAAPILDKAWKTTLLLMGSGALIVVINIAGGWWFLWRHVLAPVQQLAEASRDLAGGNLARRVDLGDADELGELGSRFNRMAEDLQARIALVEHQRTFLQALVDAIPDGVRVIDPEHRVVLTNRAYREQLGLTDSDGIGDTCHRIPHQSSSPCPPTLVTCPVHEFRNRPAALKLLHRHHDSAGKVADVEIYAAPLVTNVDGREQTLVVESIRDLSEQIEYSHEQKLAELGKLATSVAHEICNPLASIRLGLDGVLKRVSNGDPELLEYFELIEREVDKCVRFTDRLLRLGMYPPEDPELVEIEPVARDMLALLDWEARQSGVDTGSVLEPGLQVMASDSGLRLVLLNLLQNAFHAMPEGGELTLLTRRARPFVEISVRDSGRGIEPGRMRHIFDPYYSRRPDGTRGVGLGLAIVRTTVESWGGSILVESEPGLGSTFTVRLPDLAGAEA